MVLTGNLMRGGRPKDHRIACRMTRPILNSILNSADEILVGKI